MSFAIGFTFKTEELKRNEKIKNQFETKADFEILDILGHGSFGRVNLVKHIQTDEK